VSDLNPQEQGNPEVSVPAGALLRQARERAGWSAGRLAAELCLPLERLDELERDAYESFGGAVFVRGYLRRAATLLGIPPEPLLQAYEARSGAARPAELVPGLPPGRLPGPGFPGWVIPAGGVLAVVALMAGSWWLMNSGGVTPSAAPVADARPGPRLEIPVVAERPGVPLPVREEPALPPPLVPEPEESSALTGHEVRIVDLPEAPLRPPGTVELRLEFTEDCWLEVTDAEERRLAYRLYRAGEVTRLRGTAPLSVFLGNADGVRLAVDDEPLAIRPASRRDGTARFTVGGGAG
jgi:cytoskeleton protein RodZ